MVVAIAGATGSLGQFVTAAFLNTPFRGSFQEVRILTRNPDTPVVQEFQKAGATVIQVDFTSKERLEAALKGVTIVVDVLGGKGDTNQQKDLLLDVIAGIDSVKYYIPSEFGIDTRHVQFKDPTIEWNLKINREKKARGLGKFRVISIFTGLFLEITFGPWLGFDVQNQVFTGVQKADVPFSLTSKVDIGLAIASLASLAIKGAGKEIPDHVLISGITTTIKQAAELFSKHGILHSDRQSIKVETIPLESFKAELDKPPEISTLAWLRFLISDGKLDFGSDNHNKLVNPNSVWKFTSLEEYIKSVNGRPFCSDSPPDTRTAMEQVQAKIGLPDLKPSHYTADVGQTAEIPRIGTDQTSLP
ncbi:NmrA-like family-domain-containing protein [Melampsora americana]|nr:NmrA-like family-domain-containing protein [Melampsora americana]